MRKFSLRRKEIGDDGAFGELYDCDTGKVVALTLERTYPALGFNCEVISHGVKVPEGEFVCRRGPHRLGADKPEFETFEVCGIPGHWGILFHKGNRHTDSDGCILLGTSRMGKTILESGKAFARFMKITEGLSEFILEVSNESSGK